MIISNETAKTYLLERVGELKHQVSHGNPFVFGGAFMVLNALGKAFNFGFNSVGVTLNRFAEYPRDAAELVDRSARLMFEGFTLTSVEEEISSNYLPSDTYTVSGGGGSGGGSP